MIQVLDVQFLENMPPEEYFRIPAISHSFIRHGGHSIKPTAKMRFGTLVDTFVFEPQKYDGSEYKLVKPVAAAVIKQLGNLIYTGKRQLAVVCRMVYNGMYIIFKGRVDLFAGNIVIDLKVSDLDINKAIDFFRYDLQLSGYMIALQCRTALLVSVHPKKYTISSKAMTITPGYWENVIMKYGAPVTSTTPWAEWFRKIAA